MYKPDSKTAAMLEAAMNHINSVPYKVSLRWVFYRMLQDEWYTKTEYKSKFQPLISKARKEFYDGWHPNTLSDEGRTERAGRTGYLNEKDFLETLAEHKCYLDRWNDQPVYLEIWFEAKAMTEQFKTVAPEFITLRPFSGDPSLPFKWEMAMEIRRRHEEGHKVVILYFGDYDKKGMQIPQTTAADIRSWTDAPFDMYRVGLNEGDGERLGIAENFDKPGTYQWEALDDRQARLMIREALDTFLSPEALNATIKEEDEITRRYQAKLG